VKKTLYFYVAVLSFTLAFLPIHSEVSVAELKGLDEVLADNYKHLSPVQGCLAWKTNYIENIWRSTIKSAPQTLIKYMFHLQHDGVTFGPTISATSLATYLDEVMIGEVLGVIQTYRNQEKPSENDLKKALEEIFTIGSRSEELEETIKSKLEEEGKKIKNRLEGPLKDLKQLDEIKSIEKQLDSTETKIEKIAGQIKKIDKLKTEEAKLVEQKSKKKAPTVEVLKKALEKLKEKKGDFEKEIKEKKKELKNYEELAGKYEDLKKRTSSLSFALKHFKDTSLETMAEKFANVIVDAFFLSEKDKKLFDDYILERILLSFLWRKSDVRSTGLEKGEEKAAQYFWNYYNGIAEHFDKDKKTFLKDANILDRKNDAYKKFILKDAYTFEDYENYEKNINSWLENKENISKHFSDIVFSYFGYFLYEHPYPPYVRGANVTYKGITFPDCGSTSARNFWNIIAFNQEKSEFDTTLLEKIAVEKEVYDFYKKHPDLHDIETQDTYNAWAAVCSGIPGVSYLNEGIAEINAGLINMSKVLAHQMNFDRSEIKDEELPKEVFKELEKRLKENGITLDVHKIPDTVTSKENVGVTYSFELKKEVSLKWTWFFGTGHFQVSFKTEKKSEKMTVESYKKLLGLIKSPLHACLLPIFYRENENTEKSFVSFFTKNKGLMSFFVYTDHDDIKDLLVRSNLNSTDKDYLSELNGRVIPTMKNLDILSNIVKLLIDQNLKQFVEGISTALKRLPDDKKAEHLKTIIESKKTDFYSVIKEILPTIRHENSMDDVLNALIEKNLEEQYETEIKEGLKKFSDDYNKTKILVALIGKNLAGQYKTEIKEGLKKFSEDGNKSDVLVALIGDGLAEQYEKEIKEGLKNFSEYGKTKILVALIGEGLAEEYKTEIEEGLKKFSDDYNKSDVLAALIGKGLAEQYKKQIKEGLKKFSEDDNKEDDNKSEVLVALIGEGLAEEYKTEIEEGLKNFSEYDKTRILVALIRKNLEEQYKTEIKEGLKNFPEYDKADILVALIQAGLSGEYTTEIEEGLKNFSDDDKTKILAALIEKNLAEQYETEIKEGLKNFSEYNKTKILVALIGKNLAEQYETEIKEGLKNFSDEYKARIIWGLKEKGFDRNVNKIK